MILSELDNIFIGNNKVNKVYIGEEKIWTRNAVLRGVPPLEFISDGTDLLDWSITGAAGGVGKIGKNYLKQTELTIPSGSYGERVYTTTSWITARIGTFNSNQATTIGFNLHKSDNSNITPANVGKMYIVEGDGDPEKDGFELDVFQGGITQMGDDRSPSVYHLIRYGDDGTGNIQQTRPNGNAAFIPIRCGTELYELKPNTGYKFARIGGDADVEIQYVMGNGTRTVSVQFVNAGVPAIPEGGITTIANAQWCKMIASENYYSWQNGNIPIDCRAESYENCTAFADLKAGRYKVITEAIIKDASGLFTELLDDNTPYFMLIDNNNNKVITKTPIFVTTALWHHEEYDFTLAVDTKIGLFYKAYFSGSNAFTRFMIVDYDIEPIPFDILSSYGQLTGVSCWESYRCTIPIIISKDNLTRTIDIEIESPLGATEAITMAMIQVSIPTYSGANTLSVDTDILPSEVYIKYNPLP